MKIIYPLSFAFFCLFMGGYSLQKFRKESSLVLTSQALPTKLNILKNNIEAIIKNKKATVGVAIIIDGKDTLTLNNAEKYPMMSVYKFHQALAVCDYLKRKNLPLTTLLYLDKKFFIPNTYSPLRDKYPLGNLELPLSKLLTYTLQLSDNIACDILFDYIGGVNIVHEYIHSLGIKEVSIATTENEMHQVFG